MGPKCRGRVPDHHTMCTFGIWACLRVQVGASPSFPQSGKQRKHGEQPTCTHIQAQIIKVHLHTGTPNAHSEHFKQVSHFLTIFLRVNPYEICQNWSKMTSLFYGPKMLGEGPWSLYQVYFWDRFPQRAKQGKHLFALPFSFLLVPPLADRPYLCHYRNDH